MAWNRTSDTDPSPTPPRPKKAGAKEQPSVLGPSIAIKGTLRGSEDLQIEGSVEGTIRFDEQSVVVSESGRIKADIFAHRICVAGEVEGNLVGEREIVIRPSGQLEGNITAPSVTLENGAKFRGSIDMEPTVEPKSRSGAPTADKAPTKPSVSSSSTPTTTPAAAGSS